MLWGSLNDVDIIQINGTIMISEISVSSKYVPRVLPIFLPEGLGIAFIEYPPLSELPLQQRQDQYDEEQHICESRSIAELE